MKTQVTGGVSKEWIFPHQARFGLPSASIEITLFFPIRLVDPKNNKKKNVEGKFCLNDALRNFETFIGFIASYSESCCGQNNYLAAYVFENKFLAV